MSLLTIYTNDTAGNQQKTNDAVKARIQNLFQQNVSQFNTLMSFIWANPYGLSPQDAVTAMGTDFGTLVQFAGYLANMINSVQANTLSTNPPNGHAFTVNPDGTGTVTA